MSERTPPLRCPKCDGQMREVERRGIVVDICAECRGVFFDRGELDTLIEAVEGMNAWYGQQAPPDTSGAPTRPGSSPAWQDGAPAAGQTGASPGQWAPQQGQGGHSAPPQQPWQGQHGAPQGWQGQGTPQGQPKKPLEDAVSLFRSLAAEHKRHKHADPHRRSHRKGGMADFFNF